MDIAIAGRTAAPFAPRPTLSSMPRFAALLFFCASFSLQSRAQSYTSYFTGDTTDAVTQPTGGICLMGGATEDDSAMRWFLRRAAGGDVVVIRASGGSGYNNYLYSQLGIPVNSVQTIVFNNAAASQDPYVRQQLRRAEAVWIAGGDQWNYVQRWRGTPVDSILNYLITVRRAVVGGTSAGMAILGEAYFSAQVSSVTSATALANPFAPGVTVDTTSFIRHPLMRRVITDTHYDNPDRRGRQMVFFARLATSYGWDTVRGIACDEYTAVCIDTSGVGRVFGGAPAYDDNAYFLQMNCKRPDTPEVCAPGQPLMWVRDSAAIKVYTAKGNGLGTATFDLKDWKTGTGGSWEHWWVSGGVLNTGVGSAPACTTATNEVRDIKAPRAGSLIVSPNPSTSRLTVGGTAGEVIEIFSVAGRRMERIVLGTDGRAVMDVESWPVGVYAVVGDGGGRVVWVKR